MSGKTAKIFVFIAAVYLISVSLRLIFPAIEKPHLNQNEASIELNGEHLSLSYLEFDSSESASVIVLFHDPFIEREKLEPFAKSLSDEFRVLIPIFPTQTEDGSRLSYSAESRAEISSRWIEKMDIPKIHVAGNGFGNAVAIEFLKRESVEIESYAMLSALGVQEFHFLGYHLLNQPIYSLLYPIGFMIDYGLPIAGWNAQSTINMESVRFINELDQRPYRDILNSLEIPVLIMHGKDDNHVSKVTAYEHYRIIPQSEIWLAEGGRHSVFEKFDLWAAEYSNFLTTVERGTAVTRSSSSQERIEKSEKPFQFGNVPPVYGWGLVIIILLLSSVTIVSEDLGCIGGGLLVAGGIIQFWVAFLTVYIGIILVDAAIYWLGRKLGRPILTEIPFRWFISKKDIERSEEMFQSNGFKIIFITRFLPGTRFPTYFTAGLLRTRFSVFITYFLIAITIWTPLVLGISTLAGQQMLGYLQIYQDYALHIFLGLVLGLYILFKVMMPMATKKGRREFAVRVIRLKQQVFS